MNIKKELKKYIKDNLKEERGFFSNIKNILAANYEMEDAEIKQDNNSNKDSSSHSFNLKEVFPEFSEDENDFSKEQVRKKEIFDYEEAMGSVNSEPMPYASFDVDIPEFLKKSKKSRSASTNINQFINENVTNYNDFQTLLFKYIDDRNLKDSDVYNKVHIDRRTFSKIRSDSSYHPSKETVILLGLSLELTENEIDELLLSAAYSLPKNNHYDLIIRFCFINKIYKLIDVNDLLDEYNCKLFNY